MNVADSDARCFLKRKYYIENKFQQFEIISHLIYICSLIYYRIFNILIQFDFISFYMCNISFDLKIN